MKYPKRLIEVDLPIARISAHARREKSIRHGHISTLHIWWARRPLAACRSVICATLWPDPADELCPQAFRESAVEEIKKFVARVHPKRITGESKQLQETGSPESRARWEAIAAGKLTLDGNEPADMPILRNCLLDFIADFANWDNNTVAAYLETSRALTQAAHEALGNELHSRPLVVDPFAGGGAIPLEALRIGADTFASDLNPVPFLLNKLSLRYVPQYGQQLADQVKESAAKLRSDLELALRGYYFSQANEDNRLVFFWGRTINCEGPTCGCRFPLIRSLWLRQKPKRGVALALAKNDQTNDVDVEILDDVSSASVGQGTSKQGAATCPACGYTTPVERVREQLSERHGGGADAKLLAVGFSRQGEVGKFYRLPTKDELQCFEKARANYVKAKNEIEDEMFSIPREELNHLRGFFNVVLYGMRAWGDLFNPRQALLMVTLTKLVKQEHARLSAQHPNLADAVATCLALIVGKVAQYNSACCRWKPTGETLVDMFGRQAIPMVWDFAEAYPFSKSTGDLARYSDSFCAVLENLSSLNTEKSGQVQQATATKHPLPNDIADAMVTDPPYYDAIPYADLSDFFYVWLRRMLGGVHPQLFGEPLSPKADEAVTLAHRAAMYRHKDRGFFEKMMSSAMSEGRRYTKPSGIGVVVFANKSTSGWEAMLTALVDSGWTVTASWPIDTEMASRLRAQDSAVLSSSVHLVCRPRENPDGSVRTEEVGEWRDVLTELPKRIHEWMPRLAAEGVVGADAIFACLGPALEIFSRYSRVEKASGEAAPLREYLEHVWAAVSTEALSMIFKDADAAGLEPDGRLTAMWLWTLGAGSSNESGDAKSTEDDRITPSTGYTLEFDAARKIAQGLGVHLERSEAIIEVKGDKARLLPVSERTQYLFGTDGDAPATGRRRKKKPKQKTLFEELGEAEAADAGWGDVQGPSLGETVLDRVHQTMILFAAGRSEAMKRFLVEDGAGTDARFWKLAQSLSALYPGGTDEKRWVDGVLARKKGLGL